VSQTLEKAHVLGTDKGLGSGTSLAMFIIERQKSEKQGTRTLNLGFTKLRERSLGEPRATIAPTSIDIISNDDPRKVAGLGLRRHGKSNKP
jgi:hypothetical protein